MFRVSQQGFRTDLHGGVQAMLVDNYDSLPDGLLVKEIMRRNSGE